MEYKPDTGITQLIIIIYLFLQNTAARWPIPRNLQIEESSWATPGNSTTKWNNIRKLELGKKGKEPCCSSTHVTRIHAVDARSESNPGCF